MKDFFDLIKKSMDFDLFASFFFWGLMTAGIVGLYWVRRSDLSVDGVIAGGFFGFLSSIIFCMLLMPIPIETILCFMIAGIVILSTLFGIIVPKVETNTPLTVSNDNLYMIPLSALDNNVIA